MDRPQPFILADSAVAQNYRLFVHEEAGSTNDEAMSLAREGALGRTWIIARAQSSGRGRHGRHWVSPPGNLYASLLLIDEVPMRHAPQLGFVAGIALAKALRKCAAHEYLRLKWPNDILFDGAKLAGILLESAELPDGRFACVIGFGVNCAAAPRDLPYRATALAEIGAPSRSPEDVLLHLSDAIVGALARFAGGADFETIRAEWLSLAAGLGAPIKVDTAKESFSGIFRTIDSSGRLIVDTTNSTRIIEAGDVWLAPQTCSFA